MINVSELIEDPDFCQPRGITIKRTKQNISDHRVVETIETLRVQGIITISNENEDELLPESDRNKESIHVFTYNRLKCTGKDKKDGINYGSDIVVWNGNEYIVRYCLDDAQYGFCRSTAVKIEQNTM